jgi:hypothetical protein
MPGRAPEVTALTVLTVAEIPNFWSGFLPSLFTIATFSGGDPEKVEHTKRWIRRGELQAVGLSLALGTGAAVLAREPWPLLGTIAMCAYLAWQYENALAKGCSDGPGFDMDHPEQAADSTRNRWYPKASPRFGN